MLLPLPNKQRSIRPLHALAILATVLLLRHHTHTPVRTPPPPALQRTHFATATYGGVGNQLYFLAEALHLARRANLTLILPSIPPRNFGNRNPSTHGERSADALWDLPRLSRIAHIATVLPQSCPRFSTVYLATRQPAPTRLSSRIMQVSCAIAKRRYADAPRREKACAQKVLRGARVVQRVLPLSHGGNVLLEELRALKAQCVFVDGHSYNRAGNFGHEYLYSFMHYIEAAPAIRTMAREWVSGFGDICAVHLRWDEQECKGGKKGLVCMRVGIAGSGKGISWVEQTDVADAILNVGRGRPIYLASSPYVPEDVERDLRSLLAKKTRLVRKVDMKDHVVGNFVEREIAIVADVFIGEVGSTWSGTVYYKRRTLGKETVWGCRSLGVDCVLGYYVKTGKLQKPQWFEEREGRFMQTDRGIIPQRNKLRL